MVDEALHTIWAWRARDKIDPRHAARWEDALSQPVEEVARVLVEDTEAGRDLRQSSPFVGMLSEAERRKILAADS